MCQVCFVTQVQVRTHRSALQNSGAPVYHEVYLIGEIIECHLK